MADRFNTIAGWTLFSGVVALGLSSVSAHYFQAGKVEHVAEEEGEASKKDEVPIEALLASADMAKGEAAFKKCASCHTGDQGGADGLGPNLFGIMGKGMASGGFAYSDALKAKGGKWDWASMNSWLTSPSAFVTGTKMSFAGISDPQERANLMVYLNSKGSNLALPPVPEKKEGAEPEAAAVVGDAAKGQKSFAKCASCHTATPGGANGIGPNLAGVFGEAVGQGRGGFAFSDALKGKGGTWDEATMNAWLENPAKFAPGNKMTFAGLTDAQERANVIEYLKTAK
jgi:cytochrome c